jgi:hypothetical protein
VTQDAAQTGEVMQEEFVTVGGADRHDGPVHRPPDRRNGLPRRRIMVIKGPPGRVSTTLDIELGRLRRVVVKRSATFAGYADQIWSEIELQVRESSEMRAQ